MDLRGILTSGMTLPRNRKGKRPVRERDLRRILLDGYYRSIEAFQAGQVPAKDPGTS